MSHSLFCVLSVIGIVFASFARGNVDIALGSCANFAVMAGTAITFGGVTANVFTGSIGVSPGTSIGGNVILGNGAVESQSTQSIACARDLDIAYLAAFKVTPTVILALTPGQKVPTADLAGLTLTPGVYASRGGIVISAATVTLDGQGDSNAQFIFQAATNMITYPATSFILINGAQAANVYWAIGTACTIGQAGSFVGTIMAGTAVVFMTETTLVGRALSHSAVTMAGATSVTLPVYLASPVIPTVPTLPVGLKMQGMKTFTSSTNLRSVAPVSGALAPIDIGACSQFGVMAGTAVSFNNQRSVIGSGNIGVSPGSSVTGSYQVKDGSIEINTGSSGACAADRITAWKNAGAAVCPSNHTINVLADLTITPGVYCTAGGSMSIAGSGITLDGLGNKDSVWIFQIDSTLLTSPMTKITLINGAQANNVFWKVGSSATLGYSSTFVGTILSYASITVNLNTVVIGRALAGAAVSFISNSYVTIPLSTPTLPVTIPTLPVL